MAPALKGSGDERKKAEKLMEEIQEPEKGIKRARKARGASNRDKSSFKSLKIDRRSCLSFWVPLEVRGAAEAAEGGGAGGPGGRCRGGGEGAGAFAALQGQDGDGGEHRARGGQGPLGGENEQEEEEENASARHAAREKKREVGFV